MNLISKTKHFRRTVTRGDIKERVRRVYRRRRWLPRPSSGIDDEDGEVEHVDLRSAILAVSHQIHDEAIGLLYAQPIHVLDAAVLHDLIACIGVTSRHLHRQMHIYDGGHGRGMHVSANRIGLSAVADCTGLESVTFEFAVATCGRWWGNAARQVYKSDFLWLEAMVSRQGVDAALEVVKLADCNFNTFAYLGTNPTLSEKIKYNRGLFDRDMKKLLAYKVVKLRSVT